MLAWYPAGTHMPRHDHAAHQVSYLLAGDLSEEVDGKEARLRAPSAGSR